MVVDHEEAVLHVRIHPPTILFIDNAVATVESSFDADARSVEHSAQDDEQNALAVTDGD